MLLFFFSSVELVLVVVHLNKHTNKTYLSDSDDADDPASPIFARGRVEQNLKTPTILRQQMKLQREKAKGE